jgi:hypothetical protein
MRGSAGWRAESANQDESDALRVIEIRLKVENVPVENNNLLY